LANLQLALKQKSFVTIFLLHLNRFQGYRPFGSFGLYLCYEENRATLLIDEKTEFKNSFQIEHLNLL